MKIMCDKCYNLIDLGDIDIDYYLYIKILAVRHLSNITN